MFDDGNEYLPPADVEAEKVLLGGLMTYPHLFGNVWGTLDERDFYRSTHREIYKALVYYWEECDRAIPEGQCVEIVGIVLDLARNEIATLAKTEIHPLMTYADSKHTLAYFARHIRAKSVLRDTIKALNEMTNSAIAEDAPDQLLARFAKHVENLTLRLPGLVHETLDDLSKRAIQALKVRMKNNTPVPGIPSAIRDLDDLTGGWRPGQLVILGGQTSSGKTQLALNLIHRHHWQESKKKARSIFFSLEMPKEDIIDRLVSQISGIPHKYIERGLAGSFKLEQVEDALDALKSINLTLLDERDNIDTVAKIEQKIEELKREDPENPPTQIVIDFITYLKGSVKDNRNLEMEEVARDLKRLAVRQQVVVIALSQLSRENQTRQNKRPLVKDLRDSGSIEIAADIIMFVYRESLYKQLLEDATTAEIIIAKHRNGKLGTVYTDFHAETGVFYDQRIGYAPTYTENGVSVQSEVQKGSRYKDKHSGHAAYTD